MPLDLTPRGLGVVLQDSHLRAQPGPDCELEESPDRPRLRAVHSAEQLACAPALQKTSEIARAPGGRD